MARVAIRGRADILAIGVALRAWNADMHSRERIAGVDRVIEFGSEPVDGRVADCAVVRQASLHVIRILGRNELRLVAGVARSLGFP